MEPKSQKKNHHFSQVFQIPEKKAYCMCTYDVISRYLKTQKHPPELRGGKMEPKSQEKNRHFSHIFQHGEKRLVLRVHMTSFHDI